MFNKNIRAFVAGSAFPVVMWPAIYLGIPTIMKPEVGFSYVTHMWTIPVLVGLLNILFINIRHLLPFKEKGNYWLFGALDGLVFSLIGNFSSNIPTELFGLSGPIQYLTIPTAIVLYSCIWRFVVRNINKMMSL